MIFIVVAALSFLFSTGIPTGAAVVLRGNIDNADSTPDNIRVHNEPSEIAVFGTERMDEDVDFERSFGRRRRRQRLLGLDDSPSTGGVTGTRHVMVVRVQDNEGRCASREQIQESFYGEGPSEPHTVKSIFERCSYNNLKIEPSNAVPPLDWTTDSESYEPGITKVVVDVDARGTDARYVKELAEEQVLAKFGNDFYGKWDSIVYCLPYGTTYNDAPAPPLLLSGRKSIISTLKCRLTPDRYMDFFGQSFGLAPSYVGESGIMRDATGFMGDQRGSAYRCFNAAKSYQLNWYKGAYASYSEHDILWGKVPLMTLIGVDDYGDYKNNEDGFVSVRIKDTGDDGGIDYYIGYNQKSGITRGVSKEINKVHLLQKSNGPYETGESRRLRTLGPLDEYTWRVGTTAVSLQTDSTMKVRVSGRSLLHTVNADEFGFQEPKEYNLSNKLISNGLRHFLRIKHTGEAGGIDWYIDYQDNQLHLSKRTSGPYGDGQSKLVKTTNLRGTVIPFRVGEKMFELTLEETRSNGSARITVAFQNDSPTGSPTELPTSQPSTPTDFPTGSPTELPTSQPSTGFPTKSPTELPTWSPTPGPTPPPTPSCKDDPNKKIPIKLSNGNTKMKKCKFVAKKSKKKRKKYCKMKDKDNNNKRVSDICKESCGLVGKGKCKHLKV